MVTDAVDGQGQDFIGLLDVLVEGTGLGHRDVSELFFLVQFVECLPGLIRHVVLAEGGCVLEADDGLTNVSDGQLELSAVLRYVARELQHAHDILAIRICGLRSLLRQHRGPVNR